MLNESEKFDVSKSELLSRTDSNTSGLSVKDIASKIQFARRDSDQLGRTIFLIGAGCSVTAGIPAVPGIAKKMICEIARRLGHSPSDTCTPLEAYISLATKKLIEPNIDKNSNIHVKTEDEVD